MITWYLIFCIHQGGVIVPMETKEACTIALEKLSLFDSPSKCINTKTGEILRK